ncbi:hypothetical protein FS837_003394 [Tulasnella sp. UAMH 9824]|nr:hypothetical protein FS837_003394 [Tulasnella sp. UAMH 9824]
MAQPRGLLSSNAVYINYWRLLHFYFYRSAAFATARNAPRYLSILELRTGSAIYVIGTVDCDWSGLINITLDNATPINFDRRACVGDICDFPWFTASGLANAEHTLNVTLTGPPKSKAPSKNIIADFRYILYTVPDGPSASASAVTSAAASPSGTATNLPDSSSQKQGVNGGLIGGVVAGIVIVILIGIIIWLVLARKRARERQAHPIDLGAEQHPLAPTGLTVPQDMTWTPWTPSASQDSGIVAGSQIGKSFSQNTSTVNLIAPGAIATTHAGPQSSSSGRGSVDQSERTNSSGQNQGIAHILPPSTDPDLVQRISETVAAMIRDGNAPPPAYEPPPPAARPPRKR